MRRERERERERLTHTRIPVHCDITYIHGGVPVISIFVSLFTYVRKPFFKCCLILKEVQ